MMNVTLIGCDALRRELYALAALSPLEIELKLLPPDASPGQIQPLIDAAGGEGYILLAFGERACEGLCAKTRTLIAAKAHDCAHLLLGSARRYARAFSENDDDPRWIFPPVYPAGRGSCCAVASGLSPAPELPEGAREYAADLSLLRDLMFGRWEDGPFAVAPPGFRLVCDPAEIFVAEPV